MPSRISSACLFDGTRGSPNAPASTASKSRESISSAPWGSVTPSFKNLSAPQSKCFSSSLTPCVSRKRSSTPTASLITSGPMPSPGTTAILFTSPVIGYLPSPASLVFPSRNPPPSKRDAEHGDARAAQDLLGGRAEEEFFGQGRTTAHAHDDHRQVEVARDLQNLDERAADHHHPLDLHLACLDAFERALEVRLGLLSQPRRDLFGRTHPRGHGVFDELPVNDVQQRQVAARRGDAERHAHGVDRSGREVNGNEYVRRFEHCYLLLRGRGTGRKETVGRGDVNTQ